MYARPFYITPRRRGVAEWKHIILCIFLYQKQYTGNVSLIRPLLWFFMRLNAIDHHYIFFYITTWSLFLCSDNGTNLMTSRAYFYELRDFLLTDNYYRIFSNKIAEKYITWRINSSTDNFIIYLKYRLCKWKNKLLLFRVTNFFLLKKRLPTYLPYILRQCSTGVKILLAGAADAPSPLVHPPRNPFLNVLHHSYIKRCRHRMSVNALLLSENFCLFII